MRRGPLVALLPFPASAEDGQLRRLGSDMAEALRAQLESIPGLGVVLIHPGFMEQPQDQALQRACQRLRVRYLISGRCHRGATGPSLYLEVARTRRWNIVWADYFRGNAGELLAPDSAPMAQLLQGLRTTLLRRAPR